MVFTEAKRQKGCSGNSAERQSLSYLTLTTHSTSSVQIPDTLHGFLYSTLLLAPTWSEVKSRHNTRKQQMAWTRFVQWTKTIQALCHLFPMPFILLENLFSGENPQNKQPQNLDFPGVLLKARLQTDFVL